MSVPVISTPSSISLARSPLFVTGKNNTLVDDSLDAMTVNLKIYSGVKTLPSGAANYTLSKTYSINEVINFEISDLVRSEFSHDFTIWDNVGYSQSPLNEALWVTPYGDWLYSDNGAVPETLPFATGNTYAFLATDGWAKRNNIAPTSFNGLIMAMSRERQVLPTNSEVIAINNSVANDFGYIEIQYSDDPSFYSFNTIGPSNGVPPDPATTNTRDLVAYIGVGPANLNAWMASSSARPSGHPNATYYDVYFYETDGTLITTVRYNLICEPKYTPYQIAFINRYGVADFITFFKRSDERGNFTQDSYQKSIYNDGFTTPSLEVGKYQSYNVNSRNSLTLNTGFVDEDYNEVIKDILTSEYVAVLDSNTWVSVVPQRGSVEYQKHINQKLINYTLTFDYGFDERSLVR